MATSVDIYIHDDIITEKQLFAIRDYINERNFQTTLKERDIFSQATYIEVMPDEQAKGALRILVEQDGLMGSYVTISRIRVAHPGKKEKFTNLDIYETIVNVYSTPCRELKSLQADSKALGRAIKNFKHHCTSLSNTIGWKHFTVVTLQDDFAERFANTAQEDQYMFALCRHLNKNNITMHSPIVVSHHPISEGGGRVYIDGSLSKFERLDLIVDLSDTIHIAADGSTSHYLFY